MKVCEATLESASPYSQSRNYEREVPKLNKELHDAYDKRTWRSRMHIDENGMVYIPQMAFKNAISEAAKYIAMQVPGKGKTTYTKHFEAGILVPDVVNLGLRAEDVASQDLYVPADGRRGGSKRVWRTFPLIPKWEGKVIFYLLDDIITSDVFEYHLKQAGNFIGIGRFRPRNNGFYGRFNVKSLKWEAMS
jgi:hypothetical protein